MFYHFNMGLSKKIKGDKLIIKTSEVRHSNVLIILFCYQNRNLISLIKSYPMIAIVFTTTLLLQVFHKDLF